MKNRSETEASAEQRRAAIAHASAQRRYKRIGLPLALCGLLIASMPITGPLGLLLLTIGLSGPLLAVKYWNELEEAQQRLHAAEQVASPAREPAQTPEATSPLVGLKEWRNNHVNSYGNIGVAHT